MSKDQMIWHRAVSAEPLSQKKGKRKEGKRKEKKEKREGKIKEQIFWHLAVSAEPLSPPTVENLTAIGVCFPTWPVMRMMSRISLMIMTHKSQCGKTSKMSVTNAVFVNKIMHKICFNFYT